jgi:hypothetical protein
MGFNGGRKMEAKPLQGCLAEKKWSCGYHNTSPLWLNQHLMHQVASLASRQKNCSPRPFIWETFSTKIMVLKIMMAWFETQSHVCRRRATPFCEKKSPFCDNQFIPARASGGTATRRLAA